MEKIEFFYASAGSDHGCSGFDLTVEVEDDHSETGRVIGGSSCNGCWQVGHDNRDALIEIGSLVRLPFGYTSWQIASQILEFVPGYADHLSESETWPIRVLS